MNPHTGDQSIDTKWTVDIYVSFTICFIARGPGGIWTGWTDEMKEDTWVDFNTGEEMDFSNWRPGDPNGETHQVS